MYYETYMTNIMFILGNIIKKKSKMHEQYEIVDTLMFLSDVIWLKKKPLLNQSINQTENLKDCVLHKPIFV